MPNLVLKQIFQQIKQQTPFVIRFISLAFQQAFNRAYLNPQLKQQLEQINSHLSHHTWLAGDDFSDADILLWFPLHAAEFAYPQFSDYPSLERYLKQITSRPAFQTALDRGQWSSQQFKQYWRVTQ